MTFKSDDIDSKEFIHVREARKVYKFLEKEWMPQFVVHHIDHNKLNNKLSNLSVLNNGTEHIRYHASMAKKMTEFLIENNLLDPFFLKNPELKLTSLLELWRKNENI